MASSSIYNSVIMVTGLDALIVESVLVTPVKEMPHRYAYQLESAEMESGKVMNNATTETGQVASIVFNKLDITVMDSWVVPQFASNSLLLFAATLFLSKANNVIMEINWDANLIVDRTPAMFALAVLDKFHPAQIVATESLKVARNVIMEGPLDVEHAKLRLVSNVWEHLQSV